MMFATVVYAKTSATTAKNRVRPRCRFRRADSVTARVADVMSTSTPVAYAPPCASTEALNSRVMTTATTVNVMTSGRTARAQPGAMPYLGRYRGTMLSRPAIADAPANQRIAIVDRS